MPYINITETDNSQYNIDEITDDNIVYCPINAICGTYEPTLITSYEQFISTYGNTGCKDDRSYDYAKDILLSGFPVLCKRIGYDLITSSSPDTEGKANITLKENFGKGENQKDTTIKIYAKYHGTYMNGCLVSITIPQYITALGKKVSAVLTVRCNGTNIESAIVYSNTVLTESNSETVASEIANGLINGTYKYIDVSQNNIEDISKYFKIDNKNTSKKTYSANLLSGKDISNANNVVNDALLLAYGSYAEVKSSEETEEGIIRGKELYEKYLGFLKDKYIWEVKFITAGSFTYRTDDGIEAALNAPVPVDEQYTAMRKMYKSDITQQDTFKAMCDLCEERQDCFAVLDLAKDIDPSSTLKQFDNLDSSYASSYAPWTYDKLYSGTLAWMPPSHCFLTNLARSAQSKPIYYPPAGVNRMMCRRTAVTEYEIGAAIKDMWQQDAGHSVNPIMYIRGTGYTVYGQRTLVDLLSSAMGTTLKSVTVRFCSIEIKKAIFNTCINLTFEQNMLRTWNEFRSRVGSKLSEMKLNGALNDYQIIMDRTTISASDLNNNIARGRIKVSINDALENFEISFEISPSYVSFDSDDTIEK